MDDKWKTSFRNKLGEYQPEVNIPPFVPVSRWRIKPVWLAVPVAAAAALTAMFLLLPANKQPEQQRYFVSTVAPESLFSEKEIIMPLAPPQSIFSGRTVGVIEKNEVCPEISVPSESIKENDQSAPVVVKEEKNDAIDGQDTKATPIFSGTTDRSSKRMSFQVTGNSAFFNTRKKDGSEFSLGGTGARDTAFFPFPPAKIGLSFRYGLSDRWFLESGVSYSYNRVVWKTLTGNSESRGYYSRHYAGVPLKLNYMFLDNGKISLYGLIGGELAVRVSKTTGHPLSCAMVTGVGVDYYLSGQLSLYAEPSLSWRWAGNADSWQRPFAADFSAGIRFHLK